MSKSFVKTLVLIMLIVGSIYQTALLWFDYPSDRNFFYNILDEEKVGLKSDLVINYDLFYPEKVAVFLGKSDASYTLNTISKIDDIDMANDGIKIIRDALSLGIPIQTPILTDSLWEKQHILLILPFTITKDILVNDLNITTSWIGEDTIIERIYIYPANDGDSNITLIFADKSLDNLMGCTLPISDEKLLNSSLKAYMEQSANDLGLRYISTKKSRITPFIYDQLLPVNGQFFDLLENLFSDRYFYKNLKRDNQGIEQFANYFFVNPENKWSIENNKSIRFGDLDAIVSYTSSGLFTYEQIEEVKGGKTTLNKSYFVVKNFLAKDTLLSQMEFSIDGYSENEKGYTFYFNYMYRGVPIVFDDIMDDYSLSYPMEVSISSNTVTKYSRLLWKNQEVLLQGNPLEVQFQKPIDALMTKIQSSELNIEDMYLGYHVQSMSNGASLKWVIDLEKERYFVELE